MRTIRVRVPCGEETCDDCQFEYWYIDEHRCELYDLNLREHEGKVYRCAQCVSGEDKEATKP
jgi:hypothetical protein